LSGVTIDLQLLCRNRWAATVAPVDHAYRVWDKVFNPKVTVFGQAFFEKACDHAYRVWDKFFKSKGYSFRSSLF